MEIRNAWGERSNREVGCWKRRRRSARGPYNGSIDLHASVMIPSSLAYANAPYSKPSLEVEEPFVPSRRDVYQSTSAAFDRRTEGGMRRSP